MESKEEQKTKKRRIPWFDVSKSNRLALATYLNQAILEKYPDADTKSLLTKNNILKNMNNDTYPLAEVCVGNINFIAINHKESISVGYSMAHALVIEADTYSVINQAKAINEIMKNLVIEGKIKVKVHELFSRHKKVEEQAKQLAYTGKDKVINVVVSTPNRLTKLIDLNAIDLSQLRCIILDCTKNEKKQTLLDYRETRNDLIDLFYKHVLKCTTKNKIKIYFY